jgi:hypothetical protein
MPETIRQILMQNLDRITPLHAVLLNFVNDPAGNPAAVESAKGMMMGNLTSVIEKTLPEMCSNTEIFRRICVDLYSMDLTTNESFGGMQSGGVCLKQEPRILGQSFFGFHFRSGDRAASPSRSFIERLTSPPSDAPICRA